MYRGLCVRDMTADEMKRYLNAFIVVSSNIDGKSFGKICFTYYCRSFNCLILVHFEILCSQISTYCATSNFVFSCCWCVVFATSSTVVMPFFLLWRVAESSVSLLLHSHVLLSYSHPNNQKYIKKTLKKYSR